MFRLDKVIRKYQNVFMKSSHAIKAMVWGCKGRNPQRTVKMCGIMKSWINDGILNVLSRWCGIMKSYKWILVISTNLKWFLNRNIRIVQWCESLSFILTGHFWSELTQVLLSNPNYFGKEFCSKSEVNKCKNKYIMSAKADIFCRHIAPTGAQLRRSAQRMVQ